MKRQSFNQCRADLQARLGKIIIELHDMGREVENLIGSHADLAKSLRLHGDSTSNIESAIREIDLAIEPGNT